jgi:transglutaminase-like putative cysteine protease
MSDTAIAPTPAAPSGPTSTVFTHEGDRASDAAPVARRVAISSHTILANFDIVFVALMSIIAVTPFGDLFVSRRVIVLAIGAVILATLINVLLRRRVSVPVATLIGLAGIAVYLTFVVFHVGVPSGDDLKLVWDGTTNSWADLLTATVPAGTRPGLAATPVMVAWLAAEIGTLLAIHTKWRAGPALPPLGAYIVALLFTGRQGEPDSVVLALVLALFLGIVLIRANVFRRQGGRRTGQSASDLRHKGVQMSPGTWRLGIILIVAMAVGVVFLRPIVPFVSDEDRVDLHERYEAPFSVMDSVSPLSQIRPGLDNPSDSPIFTVRFSGIPDDLTVDRVRTAVLDQYDGAVWGTDATFALAGEELPRGPAVQFPTASVRQDYELKNFPSSFLPELGRPVSANGDELGFDRGSGMLLAGSEDRSGVRYSVTSDVPIDATSGQVPDAILAGAKPGQDPSASLLSLLPTASIAELPDGLQRFAAGIGRESTDYETMMALEAELKSKNFGYNVAARPGHSLGVLNGFVSAQTGDQGSVPTSRVGYAEQFAATFALVARMNKLPSRVVVGYLVDPEKAKSGDVIEVKARDIHAWAEVNFNGIGWVAFDPTNREERDPDPPDNTVAPTTVPATSAPSTTSAAAPSTTTGQGSDEKKKGSVPIAPFVGLAIVLLALALIPVTKRVRRGRRRTRGSTAQRTLGAWFEARDRMRSHGVKINRAASVTEAAESSPELSSSLSRLAPIVDVALYAPDEPDQDAVDEAWQAEESLASQLSEGSSAALRARAVFDPRPLVGSRRSKS